MNEINIDQENLNDEFILEWAKSENNFGELHYRVLAKVGVYPYETVDKVKKKKELVM